VLGCGQVPGPLRQDLLAAAAIVAFGLWSLAPGLDHPTIVNWDESFHQVVTRMTYEDPPVPFMYRDSIYPLNPTAWWGSGVWLHKPPGTAWFGAVMMRIIGVSTLALRLGSVLGMLAAALSLYALVKERAGRGWALAGSLGFLALPAGWILAQGYFFGDVTDCTLVGWVTFAMLLLGVGVERQSWRWMAGAGAAVGAGFLCKSFLALVPVGVAGVLLVARALKLCDGPRWKGLGAMYGAFAVVGLPWSLYTSVRWPELARITTLQALEFITAHPGSDVAMWRRPWDAILNEVSAFASRPLPVVAGVVAVVWLWRTAVRTRDHRMVAMATWLTATELIHSLVAAKAPAHTWNAFPAVLGGLALLGSELWRSPFAGPVVLGMLATPWLTEKLPVLARLRQALPSSIFFQTRTLPGLLEGGVAVGVAALLAWAAAPWLKERRFRPAVLALGTVAGAWLVWALLVSTSSARLETAATRLRDDGYDSWTRDVGLAVGRAVPERSVLWFLLDQGPPDQFENLNLMFWSGKMAYALPPDVPLARSKGYHSYLVSALAQPLRPVEGVPAYAWLRAYDLEAPAPLPEIPEGAVKLSADAGSLEVIGVASGREAGDRDRWAFFARAKGGAPPAALRVVFHLAGGGSAIQFIAPEATLLARHRLVGPAWFVLPALGPRRAEVVELELGSSGARVKLPPPPPG